jgi:hypothetical protein
MTANGTPPPRNERDPDPPPTPPRVVRDRTPIGYTPGQALILLVILCVTLLGICGVCAWGAVSIR